MTKRVIIHRVQGVGCRCTPRELLNATTDIEKVTCRSCLRLMCDRNVRNALYLSGVLRNWGQYPFHMRRYETTVRVRKRLCQMLIEARWASQRLNEGRA